MDYLELLTVFGMIGPFPPHLYNFTGHWGHQVANDGHEIPLTIYLQLGNGETIFIVSIGDSFDLALEISKHIWFLYFKPFGQNYEKALTRTMYSQ